MQSRLVHLNGGGGGGGRDRGQSSRASGGGGEGRGSSELRKGPWREEEDEILVDYVRKNGPRGWSSILSRGLLHRDGKSCRFRWVNKLRPGLKTGKFSEEEERVVIELQAQLGNKWARIATYLPGRTENDVKNFWYTMEKRLTRSLLDLHRPEATRQDSAHSQPVPPPPSPPPPPPDQYASASHILIQESFTDDPLPQFVGVGDEYLGPRFMNYSPPRLELDEFPWPLDNFDEPPPPPPPTPTC